MNVQQALDVIKLMTGSDDYARNIEFRSYITQK